MDDMPGRDISDQVIDQTGIHIDPPKYWVEREDGEDGDDGKHADCRGLLFVLDPVHDPDARAALRAYAAAVTIHRPKLSGELHTRLDSLDRSHPFPDQGASRTWNDAEARLAGQTANEGLA